MLSAIVVVTIFAVIVALVSLIIDTYPKGNLGEKDKILPKSKAVKIYASSLPFNSLSLGLSVALYIVLSEIHKKTLVIIGEDIERLKFSNAETFVARVSESQERLASALTLIALGFTVCLCIVSFLEFVASKEINRVPLDEDFVRPFYLISFVASIVLCLFCYMLYKIFLSDFGAFS